MKYSTKLSDAVHIMVLIATNTSDKLSSTDIATSICTNPGFIRQIMGKLKKAELLNSVTGHAKPSLARDANLITLYEVYKAVEGNKPLLHLDTHTNPDCGIGINIQLSLADYYKEIQDTAEKKMREITLQDVIDTFQDKVGKNKIFLDYKL